MLTGTSSPAGGERKLAERLAEWGQTHLAVERVTWDLDVFDGDRANLLIHRGTSDGLACYAHLDTSLTGDPRRDRWITGRDDEPAPLRIDGDVAIGFGLAVARASAAVALVAFDIAGAALLDVVGDTHGLSVLLTAGGTHRWPATIGPVDGRVRFGVGARRALARGLRPAGVLNLKAGAPAPLHEEPGAAYISVRVTGQWEPALFRADTPGTITAARAMLDGVERWRADLRRRPITVGSIVGREAALGAIRSGDLDKPDLLPGIVEGRVFVVLADGDDPEIFAGELAAAVSTACDRARIGPVEVHVAVGVQERSGRTDPTNPLVVFARDAWARHIGPVPDVLDWRGSTDSSVFRGAGIPTVRLGPPAVRDTDDPRLDRVGLSVLLAHVAATVDTVVRWTLATRLPSAGPSANHP